MLKAVVLLRKKDGLTVDHFIDYYENNHVPLVRELLPTIGHYVRNYMELKTVPNGRPDGGAPTPYFDVITELWFEDEAAYQAFLDALSDPEVSRRLQEDEDNFLDRSIAQVFQVQEFVS